MCAEPYRSVSNYPWAVVKIMDWDTSAPNNNTAAPGRLVVSRFGRQLGKVSDNELQN